MARQLTQTLTLTLTLIKQISPKSTITPLIPPLSHRFLSSKPQLIEIDLDSSSSSSSTTASDGGGEIEVMGLKRLEDAIHSVIVRRLAPDWLPFRPGSSYWVPPKRKAGNIIELVGKLTNPLSDEESLSISSSRGWPCSSFFIQHDSEHQIPVEVEVQVQVHKSPDEKVSEDEE